MREQKIRVIPFDRSYQGTESGKNIKTVVGGTNEDNNTEEINTHDTHSKKCSVKAKIAIVSIAAAIALIIFLCVKLIPRNKPKPTQPTEQEKITVISEEEARKLGSEFNLTTKEGDLQKISVVQKYREDRTNDGQTTSTYSTRLTNYIIHVMSEKNSDEENKYYYDKIYECSISIQSECLSSTEENCTPVKKLDLSNPTRRNRNLEDNGNNPANDDKLKDIPIPLCLFNLTNNDVITSIACPQSLPETKKKKILLDLYFFRPPGLTRLKEKDSNSTIDRETVGNRKYIREVNGGICDIENAQFSFCSTEMNTTTDLENRILTYDELAVMKVTSTDPGNYFVKTKTTNLVDETDKLENFDKTSYKNSLEQIVEKLKPHLKYEVLFSQDNFEEFYYLSKNNTPYMDERRRLKFESEEEDESTDMVLKENNVLNIFTPTSGISADVTLLINSGLGNNENAQADNLLYLNNKKQEVISQSKESSKNLKEILKDLLILTNAGNHEVTILLQNTNVTLENLTEEINKAIALLNKLVKYKDLSDIFDSTSSFDLALDLPFSIIQETSILKGQLEELLTNIENGGIKNNIKILNQNIYDYVEEAHKIVNELFDNLNELSKSLSTEKSILTEISTYYLNHTTRSYSSTIKQAQEILTNYYKDEFNLISPMVEKLLNNFEEKIDESVEKELRIINNLYEKIESKNYTIKGSNEEDLKTILNNLYYIKYFLQELKEKIIKKVKNEMNLKPNGYFISDYDLNSNQETFSKILEKTSILVKQLDNDEHIDVNFDNTMKSINNNFTSILKYADKQKEELFPLNEDVLKTTDFKSEFQKEMKDKIIDAGVQINNKIRKENNYYLEHKKEIIDEFVTKNKELLDNLVIELDNLFSVINIEELAVLFENALNSSLLKTKNEIKNNSDLADEYFQTLSQKKLLLKILKTYHIDEKHLPSCISRRPNHEVYLTNFSDSITSISKTTGYISKYNTYKNHFEKSKVFLNNELYPDLLSLYKNFMLKIREILQVFKNNKLSDKYPDLTELSFIDDHIRVIDNFYSRFDMFVSDDKFNNKYIKIIEDFKKTEKNEIDKELKEIESCHKIINVYPLGKDYNYDICLKFKRIKTYTCVNGVIKHKTNSDNYCLPAASMSSNYLKLKDHSVDSDTIITQFNSKFKQFHDLLSEKINSYTSKINSLKQSLSNLEKETINQKYTLDYLTPIQNYVSSVLSDKYGDKIIESSYNYYQNLMSTRIKSLFDDVSDKWYQYYDNVYTDIKNNLQKYNNSITEFANILSFYLTILTTNITSNYYDSIEVQQKTEFNYTIKYYYNILLKSVKSAHQYVISKLPLNSVGFNNIINLRKKEVNDVFTKLIKNIQDSKDYALNFENQIYVTQVAETNFFNTNDILKNNVLDTSKNLMPRFGRIKQLENGKSNTEYSLSSRFYLENSENGRQVEELYEQIDKKVFVYLNLEKFKELLIENWIFDQDEFIRSLKELLYNSDLEVKKELNTEKEKYVNSLEKEITKTYNKDDIAKKINELYVNEIKDLSTNQINEIKQNLNDIINKIKEELTKEAQVLKTTVTSLNKDYSKIKERLQNYKNSIKKKLEEIIFAVINQFNQKIMDRIYTNFFEKNLDKYIEESENTIKDLNIGEIKLLSDTYDIGQIIHNIILNICNGYKTFTKTEINSNYEKYLLKLKNAVNIENLKKTVNDQIDNDYNTILLTVLKEVATNEIGIQGYEPYDFKESIINTIDQFIETKFNNIKKIMETTKGKNYDFDMKSWKKMDFSLVYQTIVNNCNSLSNFVNGEKDDEKEHVDEFLKNIMRTNFNDLLKNIIPSFGNDFFERITAYNENFKITSLYKSLQYSLIVTIAFYQSLFGSSGKIKALTKDLKLKIYSLNDLDLIAQKRNKEVLELLNSKVEEFIINTKDFLIEKYILFFQNDVSIEKNFTGIVRQEILDNLIDLREDFNTDYLNLMNEYFKDKLITSYTKTMNKETKEMVATVEDLRESLKVKIDDLFSLDPDEVLSDINNKMDNTLNSIDRYNKHFGDGIIISTNLENFLNYYGTLNVKPKFIRLLDIMNEATKNGILDTIDKNSENYLNYYDTNEFIEKTNNIHSNIQKNYLENLNNSINKYGIEEYPNNLEKEILRQTEIHQKTTRRLLSGEEMDNLNKEKIADKAIDETFKKILASSSNAKTFIYSLEKFVDFDKLLDENINKLNIAYKISLKRIKDNKYPEEVHNNLTLKLSELKNSTLDYYNGIKTSFHELKDYLQNSINEIDNDLNQCANITYITFAEKYENYTNINNIDSINNEELGKIIGSEIVENQAKITTVNYTLSQIKKDTQFIFKVFYEDGEIKKPRVKATIINKSKPSNIEIKFINEQEDLGDIIERINAEINNVNFTMDISFTTASKDLNVTTITDFESFKYSRDIIEIKPEIIEKCETIEVGNYVYNFCYNYNDFSGDNYQEIMPKKETTIEQKRIIEEAIVHENVIFNS